MTNPYTVTLTPFNTLVIRRVSDGAFIPEDLENGDYRQYLEYAQEENNND